MKHNLPHRDLMMDEGGNMIATGKSKEEKAFSKGFASGFWKGCVLGLIIAIIIIVIDKF